MMFLSWLRRPLPYPRIPERLLRASPSTEDSWNRHSACPDTWTQVCGSGRGALFSWRWWCPFIPGNRRVAGSQLLPAHTSLSHACYSSASFFIFSPSVMLQTQARCVIQGRLHLVDKKPYVPAHALLSFQKLPNHTRGSLFVFMVRPRGHRASWMFLGLVPVTLRRLVLGSLLCRCPVCLVVGASPLSGVWRVHGGLSSCQGD